MALVLKIHCALLNQTMNNIVWTMDLDTNVDQINVVGQR
jgi:hypothetical protein